VCELQKHDSRRIDKSIETTHNLLSFYLAVDQRNGECSLTLNLSENKNLEANRIYVEFVGVTNLSLDELDGGLIQLILLTVEDIKDQQLDKLYYQVSDLGRESMCFYCRKWIPRRPEENS
jgi:hypothetical protein